MRALVVATIILLNFLAAPGVRAEPRVTARLDPAEVAVGEAARLTITATGAALPDIDPSAVPGLTVSPMGQSRRIEFVNGVTTSTATVTYQVIPRQPGTYVLSSIAPGVGPLTLRVDAAGSGTAAGSSAAGGTAVVGGPAPAGGAAFVHLNVPTHDLYVGESLPVDIQVGTRDGVVASLNGTPVLKGDAFTLDKLAPEPNERSEAMIEGKPYTVFTWHSVLAAVKPGLFSLTMETPLTVRVQAEHPAKQFLDDANLADFFNDPAFQGFFGGTVQKDITVASAPLNFKVLELPVDGRPKDYSGAVGHFKISTSLEGDSRITQGDPITLKLVVSGEGNFDRVTTPMLSTAESWKTYQPTAKFNPADGTAYRGEKVFEQPLVATAAGKQSVPSVAFSYFDPATRRYVTLHSEPLEVDVTPAAPVTSTAPVTAGTAGTPNPVPMPVSALRPDHEPGGSARNPRLPWYYQPAFSSLPVLLLGAFPGVWWWLALREKRRTERDVTARVGQPRNWVRELDAASSSGNAPGFFQAARSGLQAVLGARWSLPPERVTLAEIESRLGNHSDLRRLFTVADEAIYSGRRFPRNELDVWKRVIVRELES